MIKLFGIVIARQSEIEDREDNSFADGFNSGVSFFEEVKFKRISPRTVKPMRKYTKRK